MVKDWLDSLNSEQQEAVRWTKGPVVVLAGAGSGKTRVLTYRAAYLLKEKQVSPERVLLLTFTNQAGQEMKRRIEKLITGPGPWAGTFHSWCARVLRKEGYLIGIGADYLIYDEKDQQMLIKGVIEKLNLDLKEFKPQRVLATISEAKNELV